MRPSAAPAGTEYVSRRIEGHGVTMAKNLVAWQLAREPVAAPVDVVWIVEHLDGDRADRGVDPEERRRVPREALRAVAEAGHS